MKVRSQLTDKHIVQPGESLIVKQKPVGFVNRIASSRYLQQY